MILKPAGLTAGLCAALVVSIELAAPGRASSILSLIFMPLGLVISGLFAFLVTFVIALLPLPMAAAFRNHLPGVPRWVAGFASICAAMVLAVLLVGAPGSGPELMGAFSGDVNALRRLRDAGALALMSVPIFVVSLVLFNLLAPSTLLRLNSHHGSHRAPELIWMEIVLCFGPLALLWCVGLLLLPVQLYFLLSAPEAAHGFTLYFGALLCGAFGFAALAHVIQVVAFKGDGFMHPLLVLVCAGMGVAPLVSAASAADSAGAVLLYLLPVLASLHLVILSRTAPHTAR